MKNFIYSVSNFFLASDPTSFFCHDAEIISRKITVVELDVCHERGVFVGMFADPDIEATFGFSDVNAITGADVFVNDVFGEEN